MSRLTNAWRALTKKADRPFVAGALRAELPIKAGQAVFAGPCSIGAMTSFSGRATVNCADIGRYCLIAPDVVIGATAHRVDRLGVHSDAGGDVREHRQVKIGNDVWIGAHAVVMPGVEIADGAVIGAGAVVTHNVPPYGIAVGVPARVQRFRFDQATIIRLLRSQWWRYEVWLVAQHAEALEALDAIEGGARLPLLQPRVVSLRGPRP